jgi:hypothetical protein
MQPVKETRDRGSVMLMSLVIVLLFFGMSLAFMTLAKEGERDVRAKISTCKALYLAESGVSSTIHELLAKVDADHDGLGNLTGDLAGGSFQVTAVPQADEQYDLISVGSYDGFKATVRVTAVPSFTAVSPMGAIGLSGVLPDDEVEHFAEEIAQNQVTVDGGTHPAFTIEDQRAYDDFIRGTEALMNSISHYIIPGMYTGYPTVPLRLGQGTVDMPILKVDDPEIKSELIESLRAQLYDAVINKTVPAANRTFTGYQVLNADVTWGKQGSPEITVVKGDMRVNDGRNVVGNGTLVILGRLSMEHRSSLKWNGDIYVLGDSTSGANDAWLRNDGARIDVNGNLLIVETGGGAAELSHSNDTFHHDIPDIHTIVNGVLMVAHGAYGEVARIDTTDGTLQVNGLLLMNGEKVSIEHLPGANLIVNGSIQTGLVNGVRNAGFFRLKMLGEAHVTYNDDLLVNSLRNLGKVVNMNIDDEVLKKKLLGYTQRAWRTQRSY